MTEKQVNHLIFYLLYNNVLKKINSLLFYCIIYFQLKIN